MRQKLEDLEREFHDVEARLADPAVFSDRARMVALNRRRRELEPLVEASQRVRTLSDDLEVARELLTASAGDEREQWRAEVVKTEEALELLNEEVKVLLLPTDPADDRPVIVEIRGAEGGEEANLFARDLMNMYEGVASRRGWRFEVLSAQESDLGGVSDATIEISGDRVWSRMKHEAGPHRVQRVPVTESQGRVHTSSATVVVLPEPDEVDVAVDMNDVRVETYRASGAGGQHVNKTDSAVRMTHMPTGIVVAMQDQRSQTQNREQALKVLRARLAEVREREAIAEAAGAKRSQIGGGGRSEKIRTYNFKENRVTDHRIGLTLYALERVLAGGLGDITDALVADETAKRLAELDEG